MVTNDLDIKDEDLHQDDFTDAELGDESFDWKAKAQELLGNAKRRATQLKRAKEKFGEYDKELTELRPLKEQKPPKKDDKSDEELLKRLDKLALKTEGINEADEVELFNKWKTETGREADSIVGNSIFKKELEDLRTAKANQKASSEIKGEPGGSDVKNNPDYWIAKATKGGDGKLLFPEETPKELYSKIVEIMAAKEPGQSEEMKFYNSK